MVDYVRRWRERTEIPARRFVGRLGIGPSKFHDWKDRYGKRNVYKRLPDRKKHATMNDDLGGG